jgi:hypothetical protein
MDNYLERSRAEIIMFAVAFFGFWLTIWAVTLVSTCLGFVGPLLILGSLLGFALRDPDSH